VTTAVELTPRGPFSLAEAAAFGFGPRDPEEGGAMRLAFARDDLEGHAGVVVRQAADGDVRLELHGDGDPSAVARQVARVLSLDQDGEAWLEVGRRDPVIGGLQARFPGLRPVLFHSPYEAAAWSVISARRGRAQGNATRRRVAEALGATFELAGRELHAFPVPERLLEVRPDGGLTAERVDRLHGVARAALVGDLDPGRLAAMDPTEAMAAVQELKGLGPFYSALVVVRAVGLTDVLPVEEKRSRAAAAAAYGLDAPPDEAGYAELAEAWRPFRTWATVLLRVAYDRSG
jgi:DNA-3-methyladenine glycosylase II